MNSIIIDTCMLLDCEHKGKVYNNGEKINKSDESACTVCFCNGGEIVCTSIVCYTRNDCQGYYLPGDCCPKYDNCSSNPIGKHKIIKPKLYLIYLIFIFYYRTKTKRIC